MLGLLHRRRLVPALLAFMVALACAAGTVAARPSGASAARGAHRAVPPHAKHRLPFTSVRRAQQRKLRAQALKHPRLNLKSSFIHRLEQAGVVLPFTLRLQRPYEGGDGDDVLQLAWDTSAVPWPLAGTVPPATPSTTHLNGSVSYNWDYGADTTGYAQLGTVETILGGDVSMQGKSFDIAQADPGGCTTLQSLTSTGMALTPAGARFGIINPFSGEVNGTISLRTEIRTEATPCDGSAPTSAIDQTTSSDPPLPVAFTGTFSVSPGVSSDGHVRFGVLKIDDTVMPQRTTFGLVHACTNPAAADGCDSKAFPVRTKIVNLTAEVLLGDQMPGPPSLPDPPASTTTTSSTTTPTSTTTP